MSTAAEDSTSTSGADGDSAGETPSSATGQTYFEHSRGAGAEDYCRISTPLHAAVVMEDGDPAASQLGQTMHAFPRLRLACKRSTEGTAFTHCPQSQALSSEHARLLSLLSARQALAFRRDAASRLHQLVLFARHAEELVAAELETLTQNIRAATTANVACEISAQTALSLVSPLCDDFRMHLTHWLSLKHSLFQRCGGGHARGGGLSGAAVPAGTGGGGVTDLHTLAVARDIRKRLARALHVALYWLDKLLRHGAAVFAHVDHRKYSNRDVFSVVRGVEEFNSLVGLVKRCAAEMSSDFAQPRLKPHRINKGCDTQRTGLIHSYISADTSMRATNSPGCVDAVLVRAVAFKTFLTSLACERARYVSIRLKAYVLNDPEVGVAVAKACVSGESCNGSNGPGMKSGVSVFAGALNPSSTTASSGTGSSGHGLFSFGGAGSGTLGGTAGDSGSREDTSDYASLTTSWAGEDSEGGGHLGDTTLNSPQHQGDYHHRHHRPLQHQRQHGNHHQHHLGPLVPDLSIGERDGPLSGFVEAEQEVVSKILNVAARTTNLMRKKGVGASHPPDRFRQANSNRPSTPQGLPIPPHSSEDRPPSRSDPKRKSVSWGDSQDVAVKSHHTSRYMDTLWRMAREHLLDALSNDLAWRSSPGKTEKDGDTPRGQDESEGVSEHSKDKDRTRQQKLQQCGAGCVDFLSANAVAVLALVLDRMCCKGAGSFLPPGLSAQLPSVTLAMRSRCAISCWEREACLALSSAASDKRCQPTLLESGGMGSTTGRRLREMAHLLKAALMAFDCQHINTKSLVQQRSVDYRIQWEILHRLHTTFDLAESWCMRKAKTYLTDWKAPSFLLVACSDLKMMIEALSSITRASTISSSSAMTVSAMTTTSFATLSWELFGVQRERLKSLQTSLMMQFGSQLKKLTRGLCLSDAMPGKKVWKRKTATMNSASESHDTIEKSHLCVELIADIIDPVCEGVSKLPPPVQFSVFETLFTSVCAEWLSYFLEKKIKFGLHGVTQLEADFNFLVSWIDESVENTQLRTRIYLLPVFRDMAGVILLLRRQPSSSSNPTSLRQRARSVDSVDARRSNTDADNENQSGDNSENLKIRESRGDDSHYQSRSLGSSKGLLTAVGLDRVSDRKESFDWPIDSRPQWLSLRVTRPGRHPLLLPCFPSKEPDDY